MSELQAEPLTGNIIPPKRERTLDDILDGRELSASMRRMYEAFLAGDPIPPALIPGTVIPEQAEGAT